MKLDLLIVDLAMVAAVFLPYLLFVLIGRKKESELKNRFSEEAKRQQLCFKIKERWNNNIIGLDSEKAQILLAQKRRTGIIAELIDLKQIRACEIIEKISTLKTEQRTENILQRLDLQLKLHNDTTQTVNLYNCEETSSQDYELKHAEKWHRIINELIVFRPIVNSAA